MSRALGVSFDRAYYMDPFQRREIDARCHEYVGEHLAAFDAFHTESNLGRKEHFHPNQVLVGGIQPNLLIGMLLGAEFIPSAEGDADISPACWAEKSPEDLPEPKELLRHPVVRDLEEQFKTVQSTGDLMPIPPFFWDASGRAAIHGALTTAQKFLGETALLDLLVEPDRVRAVMDWITEVNIVLVSHFAAMAGIAIHELHVGECSSCMIGAPEWETFVSPTLERFGRELAPVRLHSCGPSNHLLEPWQKLRCLHCLDLGGETGLGPLREHFGFDFPISIAPPVKLLAKGDSMELWDWTCRTLEANRGGKLVILFHLEPQYPLEALRAWRARLDARSS